MNKMIENLMRKANEVMLREAQYHQWYTNRGPDTIVV